MFGITHKQLLGDQSIHMPLNMIFQKQDEDDSKLSGVIQSSMGNLLEYSIPDDKPHMLYLCDAIIRPHLVVVSDHMQGHGISQVYTQGFLGIKEWVTKGEILYCKDEPTKTEEA